MNLAALIGRIVDASARRRGLVVALWLGAALAAALCLPRLQLDALPDLAEPQIVVATEWMGKSPLVVEEQVTMPIAARLQSLPHVRVVRGQSMTGMSSVYAIFDEGTDLLRARERVLEQMSTLGTALPAGVTPGLGADAAGVGWVFQYALRPRPGATGISVDELRTYQDTVLRHALGAVPGVAEVATVGGHRPQYQVTTDSERLRAHGLALADLSRTLRSAAADTDGGPLELGGHEQQVTLRATAGSVATIEALSVRGGAFPVRVRDVATVALAGAARRGVADLDGGGDAVGGIVIMRSGQNARATILGIKQALAAVADSLPAAAEIVTTYDRSALIGRAIATLRRALVEETLAVVLLIVVFLLHLRSAVLPAVSLPLTVLITLGTLAAAGVPATIMSLGGIAIALGATVDAEIVMLEACHRALERDGGASDRRTVLTAAGRRVTPAIVCSLLIIAVAFLPVLALTGQAGRLFAPLALSKTVVMLVSVLLSVTLAPALRDRLLLRGRVRREDENPLSRLLVAVYRPFVFVALRNPRWTLAMGALAVVSAVPLWGTLGEEFMPALDEGDRLYMPVAATAIGPDEAARQLTAQDRALHAVPEVASVFGKAGRADTATDPAPLTMIETTVQLRPRATWRRQFRARWFSGWAPAPLRAALARIWPEDEPISDGALTAILDAAVAMPGWAGAWTMPIRARIDMQSTGVRTPIGIKILGRDLSAIDGAGRTLARLLLTLSGTRRAVFEPQLEGRTLDVVPDSEALARNGVELADLQQTVAAAGSGLLSEATAPDRRRPTVLLRLLPRPADSVAALGALLVPATPRTRPAGATDGGGAPTTAADDGEHGGATSAAPPAPPTPSASPARRAYVRLDQVASLHQRPSPAMVRDEGGLLVGYLSVDVDSAAVDLSSYISAGTAALARWQNDGQLALPPGTFVRWAGEYESLTETHRRLGIVIPLALLAIAGLLFALFRTVAQTLIVLLSIPFALVGSLWALALLDYHLSAAVWIGLVAVVGLAAQTGVVMIVYIDQAFERRRQAGLIRNQDDIRAAIIEGTVGRVRPKLMTVAAMTLGLLPLLWADSAGADVMKRIAAPMVGGLVSSAFLTLELIPVLYAFWRRRQLGR